MFALFARRKKELSFAFPYTIPILTGFSMLGMTYGVYMRVSGFGILHVLFMSGIVYAGSMQFLAVALMLAPFAPFATLLVAFMTQARHFFYGIGMLEKYKGLGIKKWYLVFGLTDETFSINCTMDIPSNLDRGWVYVFATLLNQSYWVISSVVGWSLGSLFHFDTTGLDFVMTAMFVVIFLEHWLDANSHISPVLGMLSAILCRFIFGADSFLVPTMLVILVGLLLFQKPIEKREEKLV